MPVIIGILRMENSPMMVAFWATELLFHAAGFLVAALFLLNFFQYPLFHLNFRLLIANLTLCTVFTSICRFTMLVGKIGELFASNSFLGFWLQILRDVCMYAAGFHLTLLSIERATATIKSRVYEKSRGFVWVLLLIVLTWALSFVVIYCVQYSLVSPYIALGIIVVVDGVALAVMLVLFYVNHKMYHRVASEAKHSTHSLSQRYQFSENIFSSRLLKRLLLFLAGASVIAIISYFGFVFCGDQTTLGRVSGFVFDLTIASLTSLVPIIIIAGTPRLRHSTFDRMCPQAVRSLTVGPAIPTDINGNRLIIQDETNVYFDQLKSSWN
ncbi:hypothetical protein L596_023843 [Steinernema carpocapsae]|uniref:G-protein coupled receptors family 1 profile domain-containing protein n=1 Tax=Steinernema carpocapsae TaxID=34508 RepID=A0A4U5MEV6_STECR|nr:hypothetical protein L596_023843 [Steinernema carpocapsae]